MASERRIEKIEDKISQSESRISALESKFDDLVRRIDELKTDVKELTNSLQKLYIVQENSSSQAKANSKLIWWVIGIVGSIGLYLIKTGTLS